MGGGARPAARHVTVESRAEGGIEEAGRFPGVRIRPAERDDLDAIRDIEVRAFGDPWSRDSFASLLHERLVLFAVAVDDAQRVAGYVVAWFVAGEGEIGNVAVDPALRGRGIGRQLLEHAIVDARRRGVGQIYLEVRESNAAARRLYEQRGFSAIGRRRRYYRNPVEDALVLRLTL